MAVSLIVLVLMQNSVEESSSLLRQMSQTAPLLLLPSTIGIINNIDKEHLDFYNNLDEIKRAFTEYANKIPFYGFLVVCNDDKNIKSIIKSIKSKRLITFGFSEKSNFKATNVKIRKNLTTVFDIKVQFKKKKL